MVHGHYTNTYNKLVVAFAALGSLTYGYHASIIASTIGQPGWYRYFNLPQSGEPGYGTTTTHAIATANGLFSTGGAVGCLFVMWSATTLGRRATLQIGALFSVIGGALQGGAATLGMFQAGRFIAGLGIGVLVTVGPMYLSEMSSPAVRGWLVGHHAIFLVMGYTSASWIGYGCYFVTSVNETFAWRFPLCMMCVVPTVLLAGSPWLPRSPRWLLSKGHTDEAWKVLVRLRASNDDPEDLIAKEEFYQIRGQLKLEQESLMNSGYKNVRTAVLRKKSYRKRMFIGFMMQWGTEFAGPLVINNYSVILYTSLGATGSLPLLLGALWTTTSCIYNPLGAWLHDKVNSRRLMYVIGMIGQLVTVSGLTAMAGAYGGTSNKVGNGFGIFFIFFYLLWQGTFCDTTMYLYVSEIFPTEIRPIGMGFSLFGQFAATILLLQTAPIGFVNIEWKYYLVIICWIVFFTPRKSFGFFRLVIGKH
ncbi:general substrate transporter [Xylogone sp. PMI_703]|nr:general substrate transporter [Xylogone sp. PMI_703]